MQASTARKQALSWSIQENDDGIIVVFKGKLDERSDLTPLESLSGNVTFDLAGIWMITSVGVNIWIRFMDKLDPLVQSLTFVKCSLVVVFQLSLMRSFRGRAVVESFYAPYYNTATQDEEERLLTTADLADLATPPTFSVEGGDLTFDDIPERFFAFLRG